MFRVEAATHFAEVVEFEPRGDRSNMVLVRPQVDTAGASLKGDATITEGVDIPEPEPATIRINLMPRQPFLESFHPPL